MNRRDFSALLGTAATGKARAKTERWIGGIFDRLDMADLAGAQAGGLRYGHQKMQGMVIAMAADPKFLFRDDPVAGLSAEETDPLCDAIRRSRDPGVTIAVIDHNMRFISNLCDRVPVIRQGRKPALGQPQEVPASSAVIEAYLGKKHVTGAGCEPSVPLWSGFGSATSG